MSDDSLDKLTKVELISLLKESKKEQIKIEYLLENINGISWEFDLKKNIFTYVSPNAKEILGYDVKEWSDFVSWTNMIYEEDRKSTVDFCSIETLEGRNHSMEYRMVKKTGETIWIFDSVTLDIDKDGTPLKMYGFLIDITEKKEIQIEFEKEHEYLKAVIDNVSDSIMVIDTDYTVKLMNDVARAKLHTMDILDIKAPKCYEVSHHRSTPCDSNEHPCPLKNVLQTNQPSMVVHNHQNADGSSHFFELTATPIFDAKNECIGIVESAHDMTKHIQLVNELEKKSELLQYQAYHDTLTDLPNRALFSDRLEQEINFCKRSNRQFALMFIDLDNFKSINDTYGHHIGDEVLIQTAQKIGANVREIDTFSRLGGDEFTIILKDMKRKADVSAVAGKILKSINIPYQLSNNLTLNVSCSIGISIYKESDTADDLLKGSDDAMYIAKKAGRNNFQHDTRSFR